MVIVYTGDGKGKTSASLGLMARALGNRWNVAFIQFIKYWGVGEHVFIRDIQPLFKDQLHFYKGGKGFYQAPDDLSPGQITPEQHRQAAEETFAEALRCATSGTFQVVICDEINNAVHDGLLTEKHLKELITKRSPGTSLRMRSLGISLNTRAPSCDHAGPSVNPCPADTFSTLSSEKSCARRTQATNSDQSVSFMWMRGGE